jgi:hypothetical protein
VEEHREAMRAELNEATDQAMENVTTRNNRFLVTLAI